MPGGALALFRLLEQPLCGADFNLRRVHRDLLLGARRNLHPLQRFIAFDRVSQWTRPSENTSKLPLTTPGDQNRLPLFQFRRTIRAVPLPWVKFLLVSMSIPSDCPCTRSSPPGPVRTGIPPNQHSLHTLKLVLQPTSNVDLVDVILYRPAELISQANKP